MRLPRDWLGPREELIPFGAAAGAVIDDPSSTSSDVDPDWPRGADDFWGENSHSLHHALQGPASPADRATAETTAADPAPPPVGAAAPAAAGASAEPAAPWDTAASWDVAGKAGSARLQRWPLRIDGFISNLGSIVRRAAAGAWRGRRLGRATAAAGATASALLLVVLISTIVSSLSRPPEHHSGPSRLLAGVANGVALQRHLARLLHGAEGAVASRRALAEQTMHPAPRRVPTRRHVHKAPSSHRVHASPPTSGPPIGAYATAPPSSQASSTTPTTSGGGAGVTRNEPTATAVNASASHSSPAKSTGATGALGPIGSPNG